MTRAVLLLTVLGVLIGGACSAAEPKTFRECPQCPELVAIPGGDFLMGSPDTEAGHFDAEGPRHKVSIRPFALAIHDVTVDEFLTFLRETGYQPGLCNLRLAFQWKSLGHGLAYAPNPTSAPDQPAVCVNWIDAQSYIGWLNDKITPSGGRGPYRLPSEAEWEYAARAGTDAARWWGDDVGTGQANCNGCGSPWDNHVFAPVGRFGPNPFGLYDMLGNAWQWTEDCWNERYDGAPTDGSAWLTGDCRRHVLRGGSWSNLPRFVRSAARIADFGDRQDFDNASDAGFRVARTIR